MWQKIMMVLFTSVMPISELRGAIPLGISLGLSPEISMFYSILGNSIIVPVLLLIIRPLFTEVKRIRMFRNAISRFESRAANKIKHYRKYRLIGLYLLVAIPLPTTGVYTGCVAAVIMNIRFRNALGAIVAGVVSAGLIVYLVSIGFIMGTGI